MLYIILGCLTFVLFYIFDLNKIKYKNKYISICYPIGFVILGLCTLGILLGNYETIPSHYQTLWIIMVIISFILLISTLFFMLPFKRTYVRTEDRNTVVSTGIYALCRHPSAIWFCFFYLFLGLASGKVMMLWAAAIWIIINFFYVYVQDRWILPRMLTGYKKYQKEVPFLIPNAKSIKLCLATFRNSF